MEEEREKLRIKNEKRKRRKEGMKFRSKTVGQNNGFP